MEGIGAEAASLAGHLKLSNLCWFYDNNRITIEGSTSLAFSEDVPARFAGLGWAVQHVTDANDLDALSAAIEAFKAETERPTLIVVDSVIGYGAPHKQGTHAAHGEPLGVDEVAATKRFYHWPDDENFLVPDRVREHVAGGDARQRRPAAPRVGGAVRRATRRVPRPGGAAQPHAAPDAARRMGRRPAGVPGRRQGRRQPRLRRQGAQRGRGAGAVADRRVVGPGAVEQVAPDLRGRGRLQRGRPGRSQPALRGPRARRRRGLQRARAVQAARLPGRVPHLLRLPARRAAALRADGAPADPHLHPRLDRRGRGRAHPPAHRAPRLDPRHARRDRHAARRRQRGRRGLAGASCRSGTSRWR